jgi:hypothetical protein
VYLSEFFAILGVSFAGKALGFVHLGTPGRLVAVTCEIRVSVASPGAADYGVAELSADGESSRGGPSTPAGSASVRQPPLSGCRTCGAFPCRRTDNRWR